MTTLGINHFNSWIENKDFQQVVLGYVEDEVRSLSVLQLKGFSFYRLLFNTVKNNFLLHVEK